MATSRVGEAFHFEETDLVETASEDIDNMPVVRNTLGKGVVELPLLDAPPLVNSRSTYLQGFLIVLDVVAVNVVVRADGLPQLRTDYHAWTLSGGTAAEEHDPTAHVHERSFQQTDRDAKSNTSTPQCTLVVGDRPRVSLKLLKGVGELELALGDREQEACARSTNRHWGSSRLLLHARPRSNLAQAKHFLDLLGGVLLVASEDVRFSAFGIAKLMNLGLENISFIRDSAFSDLPLYRR